MKDDEKFLNCKSLNDVEIVNKFFLYGKQAKIFKPRNTTLSNFMFVYDDWIRPVLLDDLNQFEKFEMASKMPTLDLNPFFDKDLTIRIDEVLKADSPLDVAEFLAINEAITKVESTNILQLRNSFDPERLYDFRQVFEFFYKEYKYLENLTSLLAGNLSFLGEVAEKTDLVNPYLPDTLPIDLRNELNNCWSDVLELKLMVQLRVIKDKNFLEEILVQKKQNQLENPIDTVIETIL